MDSGRGVWGACGHPGGFINVKLNVQNNSAIHCMRCLWTSHDDPQTSFRFLSFCNLYNMRLTLVAMIQDTGLPLKHTLLVRGYWCRQWRDQGRQK